MAETPPPQSAEGALDRRTPSPPPQVSVAGSQAARGPETARGRTLRENFPPLCVLALPPGNPPPPPSVAELGSPGVCTSSEGAESRGGRPSPVPALCDRPRGLSCQRRSSSLLRFASECGCRPRPEEPPGPKLQFALQWVKPELSTAPLEETHPLPPALERGVYPAPTTTRQQLAKAKLKAAVFKRAGALGRKGGNGPLPQSAAPWNPTPRSGGEPNKVPQIMSPTPDEPRAKESR